MLPRMRAVCFFVAFLSIWSITGAEAQHSVARKWNEALLQSIRGDFARPTVHARNLFHMSAAMWDAWAAYDAAAEPYLLGNTTNGYRCSFEGVPEPANTHSAREQAISFAAYRVLRHRFQHSPSATASINRYQALMNELGYDTAVTATDYQSGDPAELGNYIASCVIEYGLQDGSREAEGYTNAFYVPVNPPLVPALEGNPLIWDLNRWQPLSFDVFIDQSGNQIPLGTPTFLSPEWGSVAPFSLTPSDLDIKTRDGNEYWVYHDPGDPPYIDPETGLGMSEEYKWSFLLVAMWSSHLDRSDGVRIDISPAAIGNLDLRELPRDPRDYPSFYDIEEGGDRSPGHPINPATGEPYWAQMVFRGDYTRVLAEFWADGPNSETPPGHWFTILNYVNDHPAFEHRFKGMGPVLDPLEWDVKAYFALGGAMHDVAISVWGIKGWYDYIRPISALRGMAERGQSSDPAAPRYHPGGIPLWPGFVELVQEGDPLLIEPDAKLYDIKFRSWRGPTYVWNPEVDEGGVDWVRADNWWPYQRPTFVTPPFAGYTSGHSSFSRAAAEVLTALTGDAYFPGGMGEFHAQKNEFLVFEEGPSEDIVLQWATYRDASDQCSLSRIWGGIHPPIDDIPGRFIGEAIAQEAFAFSERFFSGQATGIAEAEIPTQTILMNIFPNPIAQGQQIQVHSSEGGHFYLVDVQGRVVKEAHLEPGMNSVESNGLSAGVYFVRLQQNQNIAHQSLVVLR